MNAISVLLLMLFTMMFESTANSQSCAFCHSGSCCNSSSLGQVDNEFCATAGEVTPQGVRGLFLRRPFIVFRGVQIGLQL
jgi:hypothetical protein